MEKIIVIGGGASGLVSAIKAKKGNNEVIILEKNNTCGKKILITGNGKCNYFNEDFTINHYNSSNIDILKEIINTNSKEKILTFFNSIGIYPKIKNNYYYPNSNQAITIKESLVKEATIKGVIIQTNITVENIEYKDNKFIITTNTNKITCDKLIISTGSKSYPKTGSDGFSYQILKKLNHTIITPLPALTPLICKNYPLKECSGVRTDATITMIENNKIISSSSGELQLTNNGISGICTFQLSGKILRSLNNKNIVKVSINFLPQLEYNSTKDMISFLDNRNTNLPNRTISELLDGLLNYKLVNQLLKLSKIKKDTNWNQLKTKEKTTIANNLTNLLLEIDNIYSFETSQVCTGGIPLTEINIHTMESKKQKNLYLTGELLDVDGECGGYNLSFAWLSGIIAGTNAGGTNNDK